MIPDIADPIDTPENAALFAAVLGCADDHLILGHRISQWCGHAPMLEEDLALPNIALDLLGQARHLYSYAGTLEGKGRDEDQLAFLRPEKAYKNCLLVERPNGDFAFTVLRIFYFSAYMKLFWDRTARSPDRTLREIAAKAVKESLYHQRHSAEWVIRLGDGTRESNARMRAAQKELDLYIMELFTEDTDVPAPLWPDQSALHRDWVPVVSGVLSRATLSHQPVTNQISGGRKGLHTEDFGFLLSELQFMQRAYPDASW